MQTGWLGKFLRGGFAIIAAAPACQAVILFGLDNSANQTDPGSGSPFSTVALVSDAGKSNPSGSAIHLGGGYMLTANHVGMRPYVTFDGSTFYQRDLSFSPVQVAANVDMQVFRLTTTPTVGSVNLYAGIGEQIAPALMVGWGVGRNPTVPVDSASVAWGDSTTLAKRWGVNTPRGLTNVAYQSGTYTSIYTVLGTDTGTPAGLGDSEAAATLYDSGSALFQKLGGIWYLIGMTTGVETGGTSIFGNDTSASPNGDINAFARISNYRSSILTIVPEPSSALFGAVSLLMLASRRRH